MLEAEAAVKILLPVDGSAHTLRTLDYIANSSELFGPRHIYEALTVVAPIPAHAARFLDRGVLDDHYRDEAEKVLAPVREFGHRHGLTIATHHAAGHAAQAIAAFTKAEKVDLIVMGSHGHSALANIVLGSVATGVLARGNVPVVIVP